MFNFNKSPGPFGFDLLKVIFCRACSTYAETSKSRLQVCQAVDLQLPGLDAAAALNQLAFQVRKHPYPEVKGLLARNASQDYHQSSLGFVVCEPFQTSQDRQGAEVPQFWPRAPLGERR